MFIYKKKMRGYTLPSYVSPKKEQTWRLLFLLLAEVFVVTAIPIIAQYMLPLGAM